MSGSTSGVSGGGSGKHERKQQDEQQDESMASGMILKRSFLRHPDALLKRLVMNIPWDNHLQNSITPLQRQVYHYNTVERDRRTNGGLEEIIWEVERLHNGKVNDVWCNLLRDGHDFMPWVLICEAGDGAEEEKRREMVTVVSLGETRTVVVRGKGGGGEKRVAVGHGDVYWWGGAEDAAEWSYERSMPVEAEVKGEGISIELRTRAFTVGGCGSSGVDSGSGR